MRMALASVGLALAATLAQAAEASAWSEFETRCLAPMEDFAAPVIGELAMTGETRKDGRHIFGFETESGLLSVERDPASGDALSCSLSQRGGISLPEADGFAGDFTFWAGQVLEAGRYVGQPSPTNEKDAILLRSSEWREPVLEVLLAKGPGDAAWTAIVRETDLEA